MNEYPNTSTKARKILVNQNIITMLQIEVKMWSRRNNSRQNWSRRNSSRRKRSRRTRMLPWVGGGVVTRRKLGDASEGLGSLMRGEVPAWRDKKIIMQKCVNTSFTYPPGCVTLLVVGWVSAAQTLKEEE